MPVTVTRWTVGGFGEAWPGAVRLSEWCVRQFSLIRAATVSVRLGGLRHNGAIDAANFARNEQPDLDRHPDRVRGGGV